MSAWVVILAIGLGSYVLRSAMLVLLAGREVSPGVTRTLGLVAPAALGALLAAMTLTRSGSIAPLPLPELAAVLCGFAVVRRTGNVMHAFAAGLPALWVLTAVAG